MKKIFLFSAAASIFFAACNNDKGLDTKKDVVVIDTTGMYKNNASTDIAKAQEVVAPSKPEVKTITKVIYVDRTPRAARHQTVRQANPVQTQPVNTVPDVNTTATQTKAGETGAGTSTGTGTNSKGDGNTASTTVPEKKKGWSNAAKDAAIGGASGAVLGAIIGKGKGAVIGGILGGAGGYILGRKKDKKDQVPQYVNQ